MAKFVYRKKAKPGLACRRYRSRLSAPTQGIILGKAMENENSKWLTETKTHEIGNHQCLKKNNQCDCENGKQNRINFSACY
jgi:hypothetical protein